MEIKYKNIINRPNKVILHLETGNDVKATIIHDLFNKEYTVKVGLYSMAKYEGFQRLNDALEFAMQRVKEYRV